MPRWTNGFLAAKRYVADPLADETVAKLFATDGLSTLRALQNTLVDEDGAPREGLPEAMVRYVEATSAPPIFVDPEKLRLGEEILSSHGLLMFLILTCASLPECYAGKLGVKVLFLTQKLNQDITRRVVETSKYLADVMSVDGFTPAGKGLDSTRKVRLMHAAIRHLILNADGAGVAEALPTAVVDHVKSVDWTQELGLPINQEDMAYALQSMGWVTVRCMRALDVGLTAREEEAIIHCWNVSGHYLGIEHDLLPSSVEEAEQLFEAIKARCAGASIEGTSMTEAVLGFAEQSIEVSYFRSAPRALTRFWVGDATADMLGLPPPTRRERRQQQRWVKELGTYVRLRERRLDWFPGARTRAARRFGLLGRLIGRRASLVSGGAPFRIPESLADHWSVNTFDGPALLQSKSSAGMVPRTSTGSVLMSESEDFRVRPNADEIPCPFLLSAYNNGVLVPDKEGNVDAAAIEEALARVGVAKSLRSRLAPVVTNAVGTPGKLNIFKLRDSKLDHTGSTGIRDPKVDPEKLEELLAFGENARMYREHFAEAINRFAQVDPGLKGSLTETMDLTTLLEVFGREDEEGKRYFTNADVEGLWLEGRYPEGWTPRPRDSISSLDLLTSAAKTCAERVVHGRRGKKVRQIMLGIAAAIPILLLGGGQLADFYINQVKAPLPAYEPVEVVWLDQGWTEDDWQWYYHASQGGSMELPIPYSWMINFEQPRVPLWPFGKVERLMDPVYMSRLGFLPDARQWYDADGLSPGWVAPAGLSRLAEDQYNNPDQLPVGFVKTLNYPDRRYNNGEGRDVPEVIGFNCSACHTGQLNFGGTGIRIEGGPAMTDLGKLRTISGYAMALTYYLPFRFGRFADAVLGEDHTRAERRELRSQMKDLIDRGQSLKAVLDDRGIYPTEEGVARLDAVGRIGNYVLAEEMVGVLPDSIAWDNLAVADAPVNFPHLWDTPWLDWVQYNASFSWPIVRNAGEAMGVFSAVNFGALADPDSLFQSTVNLANLYEMEKLLQGGEPFDGLRAPEWPEHILGPIDHGAAERGEQLYVENCQSCHLPPLTDPEAFYADSLWVDHDEFAPGAAPPTGGAARYLKTTQVPLDDIGTDRNVAENMAERTARLGEIGSWVLNLPADATLSFTDALGTAILQVVDAKYDSLDLSVEDRAVFTGRDTDAWPRAAKPDLVYKARPLNGVWATPPFLHNGSVQNIYQLLSPEAERDSVFWLGTKEYDPVFLGYVTGEIEGGFRFDTGLSGNSNRGHNFTGDAGLPLPRNGVVGRALSPQERLDIIEFLKAMPNAPRARPEPSGSSASPEPYEPLDANGPNSTGAAN